MNPIENFRAALKKARIKYNDEIIVDGKLHRLKAAGGPDKNSWHVIYQGTPAAGEFAKTSHVPRKIKTGGLV